jgi:predicted SAM-dependent methyltransferase
MNQTIAVNLGCGTHIAPDWVNIDNSPNIFLSKFKFLKWVLYKLNIINQAQYDAKFAKNVIHRELTKPLPFKENEVDFVYTSHFVEHLSYNDAITLMSEIHRVLKPNAVVRIVVPDLDFYMNQYASDTKSENKLIAADEFMKGLNIITKSRDPHMWMYNGDSLSERLRNAGFRDVKVCNYREGKCKDIDFLDYLPETSLHVEGIK